MASARSALIQLIEWCPLGQQRRLNTHARHSGATEQTDRVTDRLPAPRPHPTAQVVERTLMPDIRQAEPWRQARLLDAEARNDATHIERLSR